VVTLLFFISVLITALVKPAKQLNVNALRTFMLLTVHRHHEFKEICFCLFIVRSDLTPAVADSRDFFVISALPIRVSLTYHAPPIS